MVLVVWPWCGHGVAGVAGNSAKLQAKALSASIRRFFACPFSSPRIRLVVALAWIPYFPDVLLVLQVDLTAL
jgi:hypothetical protein